jgi:hypothetical protein
VVRHQTVRFVEEGLVNELPIGAKNFGVARWGSKNHKICSGHISNLPARPIFGGRVASSSGRLGARRVRAHLAHHSNYS